MSKENIYSFSCARHIKFVVWVFDSLTLSQMDHRLSADTSFNHVTATHNTEFQPCRSTEKEIGELLSTLEGAPEIFIWNYSLPDETRDASLSRLHRIVAKEKTCYGKNELKELH